MQVEVEIPFMTSIFGKRMLYHHLSSVVPIVCNYLPWRYDHTVGGKENIRVRRLEDCGTCSGSGAKPGAKIKSCSVCNGQGVVNNMQRTPFGKGDI